MAVSELRVDGGRLHRIASNEKKLSDRETGVGCELRWVLSRVKDCNIHL